MVKDARKQDICNKNQDYNYCKHCKKYPGKLRRDP